MPGIRHVTAGCLLLLSAATQAQSAACEALAAWSQDASDIRISAATHYTDRSLAQGPPGTTALALPPHCHVAGSFERRTGSDGKSYAITFALNLPDNWNGRYLFQG